MTERKYPNYNISMSKKLYFQIKRLCARFPDPDTNQPRTPSQVLEIILKKSGNWKYYPKNKLVVEPETNKGDLK